MRHETIDSKLLAISVAAYRLLLGAYPAAFRQEYGPHMSQVFRDYSRRRFNQEGAAGLLALWVVTLFDFGRSLLEEHTQKESSMNKALFVRLSGWALVVGGVIFALSAAAATLIESSSGRFLAPYELTFLWGLLLVGPLFTAVGMIGLLVRYGSQIGFTGQAVLLLGAVAGAAAMPLAFLLEAALGTQAGDVWISTVIGGLILMYAGMALFGLLTLRHRPLPRWNGLPLLAGLWFPCAFLLDTIVNSASNSPARTALMLLTLVIFGVAMVLLGRVLQADAELEPAVA